MDSWIGYHRSIRMVIRGTSYMTCNDCENWEKKRNTRTRLGNQVITGKCKILDNDFCCGGVDHASAGVIGGGGFESTGEFSCIYWKVKEIGSPN